MSDFKLQAEFCKAEWGTRHRDAGCLRSGSQPEMWWSAEVHADINLNVTTIDAASITSTAAAVSEAEARSESF
jgi:hypothetical protein